MESLACTPVLASKTLIQGQGKPVLVQIFNLMEEDVSLRKDTNIGVLVLLLEVEVTSLAASQEWQTAPAEGEEGSLSRTQMAA